MNKKLIMLPESYPIVKRLLDFLFKTEGDGFDLLLLEKQKGSLGSLIETYNFGKIYYLNEEYYGRATDPATEKFIENKLDDPYDLVYFPLNNFPANTFLFGSILGKEVRVVNSSLYGKRPDSTLGQVSFSFDKGEHLPSRMPWAKDMGTIEEAYRLIVEHLKETTLNFEITGERPSVGIIDGFAYDLERFCGYALASTYVKGKKVLDVGGGVGFGSFLLSYFADSVCFFDQSPRTVAFVESVWKPMRDNITAVQGDATKPLKESAMEEGSYDVVVLMDVIEHFEAPEAALTSIKGLLKADGLLILSTPEEDLAPYTVCPEDRWGDSVEDLLSEAIWPWHLQALGEDKLLPLLDQTGFEVVEKNYSTYVQGYLLKDRLANALNNKDTRLLKETLNGLTNWKVSDFELTSKRDPYFSNYSYNIIARKVI